MMTGSKVKAYLREANTFQSLMTYWEDTVVHHFWLSVLFTSLLIRKRIAAGAEKILGVPLP